MLLGGRKTAPFLLVVLLTFLSWPVEAATDASIFSFDIPEGRAKGKSLVLKPLSTFLLPGYAQFSNGQRDAGYVYSGIGVLGLGAAVHSLNQAESSATLSPNLGNLSENQKLFVWGLQTYQVAGSLSAYHAFRSVVKARQEDGEFDFLSVEETNDQLFTAPVRFGFLLRPTTFIPLAILSAGLVYYHNNEVGLNNPVTGSEAAFAAGVSYNAGVSEEAAFRGYLMMALREKWQSDFWSNFTTSVVFAAAHISESNRYPWPQFIMGYYFGWLTQRNSWTLSESVFLHTWWDVLAISALMAEGVTRSALWIPLASISF